MDEIFLRENFVANLIWQKKKGGSQDSENFAKEHEYILCYQKEKFTIIDTEIDHDIQDFNKTINGKQAKILKLEKWGAGALRSDAPSLYYSIKDPRGNDFYPIAPNGEEGRWRKKPENLDSEHIFWQENSKGRLIPYEVIYYDEIKNAKKVIKTRTIFTEYGTTTEATKEILALFNGTKLFDTPKPEALLQRILEISTKENDLVLDFFAGSGTTCAVAHKMKRRYIGIEQMDYIETITKERLKKVIEGEQGGISKKCGFKGGGSFVYAELKEVNLEIKKQITNANSASECLKIFNDLNERFLKRTDCKTDEIHSEEFQNLDLNEQKRICCTLLDSNEDYLNLGDIDEDAWGIDKITKKYNEIFYS